MLTSLLVPRGDVARPAACPFSVGGPWLEQDIPRRSEPLAVDRVLTLPRRQTVTKPSTVAIGDIPLAEGAGAASLTPVEPLTKPAASLSATRLLASLGVDHGLTVFLATSERRAEEVARALVALGDPAVVEVLLLPGIVCRSTAPRPRGTSRVADLRCCPVLLPGAKTRPGSWCFRPRP